MLYICIILSLDFHLATLQVLNLLDKPHQVVEAWCCKGFSLVNPSEESPGEAKPLTVALSTQPAASANPVISAFTTFSGGMLNKTLR